MAVRGHDFLRLLPRISFQLTECHGCSTVNSVKQSSARTVLTGILVLSWLIEYWPERPEPDRRAVSLRRGTRISRRQGSTRLLAASGALPRQYPYFAAWSNDPAVLIQTLSTSGSGCCPTPRYPLAAPIAKMRIRAKTPQARTTWGLKESTSADLHLAPPSPPAHDPPDPPLRNFQRQTSGRNHEARSLWSGRPREARHHRL